MPDSFSQGLNGVLNAARSVESLRGARANRQRADLREKREQEAFEADKARHEFEMSELRSQKEQELLVAESGAQMRHDGAAAQFGIEADNELTAIVDFAKNPDGSTDPRMERIAQGTFEMSPEDTRRVAETLQRFKAQGATILEEEARNLYFDNVLSVISREASAREFATLQRRATDMRNNGAFLPIQPVGGEAVPDQSMEEMGQTFEFLQSQLDSAQTVQDYDVIRGAIRSANKNMMDRAQGIAAQRTEQAQRQGFAERYNGIGQTMLAQGMTAEAMQYFSLAHAAPFLPMEQIIGNEGKVAENQADRGFSASPEGAQSIGKAAGPKAKPLSKEERDALIQKIEAQKAPKPEEAATSEPEKTPRNETVTVTEGVKESMQAIESIDGTPDQPQIDAIGAASEKFLQSSNPKIKAIGRKIRSVMSSDPSFENSETREQIQDLVVEAEALLQESRQAPKKRVRKPNRRPGT